MRNTTSKNTFVAAATALLVLASCTTTTAAPPSTPAGHERSANVAGELMRKSGTCALVTIGKDGHPQARTIDPAPPDANMRVVFVTNPRTRKVREIESDSRVTLYYEDRVSPGYVTVIGRARRIEDAAEKQRLWSSKWTQFYPEGIGSALMYEVIPVRIEVVSISDGIVGDPATWLPPSISYP